MITDNTTLLIPQKLIREANICDLEQIKELAITSGVFDEYEVHEIYSSIGHYINFPEGDELLTYICTINDKVVGFICFGRGLGNQTYEVYWICVSHQYQRNGIGSKLLEVVEDYAKSMQVRILFVETESTMSYEKARKLYEHMGYKISAIVKDYFDEGEDKIIYSKKIIIK